MKKILIYISICVFSISYGQVSIGSTAPNSQAWLDVVSTTGGVMVPSMTNLNFKKINSPANGLMVNLTDLNCLAVHIEGSYSCMPNTPALAGSITANSTGNDKTTAYNGYNGTTYVGGGGGSINLTILTQEIDTATINTAGSNYVNPKVVINGDGTGATVVLTVSGGVITGASVTNRGAGYTTATATVIETSFTNGDTFNTIVDCQTNSISTTGCGSQTEVKGKSGTTYRLVNINGQCWFADNLNEIPSNLVANTNLAWGAQSVKNSIYWGYYNNLDVTGATGWGTTNLDNASVPTLKEGRLYQWSAAMDNSISERSRGICPTGFHIPSDCEWMYLEHSLGMRADKLTQLGARQESAPGGEISYSLMIDRGNNGNTFSNNVTNFSGVFAGSRSSLTNEFLLRGLQNGYWTSTLNSVSTQAYYRSFHESSPGITRSIANANATTLSALSVRCLKD